ncbi:MAG: AAA family ATPase [Candidatus Gastranaerophilales bacterium]|nr:AAA family ATPase [Candidatus Gastranaerophilales bacterium]
MSEKKKISILIIDGDESSKNTFTNYFEQNSLTEIIGIYSDLMDGYNAVIEKKPAIVLIDISENSDLALELIHKISMQHRSCIIFVSSYESSSNTIIKAMRAGAREFIVKPIQVEDLNIALEKTKMLINIDQGDGQGCKVFTIFSNKGGIGKTSVATNLAMSLTELTGKKVALVDLNLQLGDVTTFLDITPAFDISYVVNNLNRIDESFLFSTLERYKNKNLYVLADPPYLEQAEEISADQINTVLNTLKSVFSYIIIDTGVNFDSKTIPALDIADNILLISMVNLPCIRNTQRCLDLFNRLGYESEKIKLIVNRYLPGDEIRVEDVEDVLGHSIYWKIPNNYLTMMSAINKGIPVSAVDASSPLNRNFVELAALLSNTILNKESKDMQSSQKTKNLFDFSKIKHFIQKLIQKN